jgi:hypothetical protein
MNHHVDLGSMIVFHGAFFIESVSKNSAKIPPRHAIIPENSFPPKVFLLLTNF